MKIKNLKIRLNEIEKKMDKVVFHRYYEQQEEIKNTKKNLSNMKSNSNNYDIDSRIEYLKRKNVSVNYKI